MIYYDERLLYGVGENSRLQIERRKEVDSEGSKNS